MSLVPTIRGWVSAAGVMRVTGDERRRFTHHLRTLTGKEIEIVVRERKSQRSLDQNAYLWSVPYPLIAEALGYEPHEIEELHYALVAKWGGEHFDKRIGAMVPNRRSSKLTTKEFSDYMEWRVRFGATTCGGLVIPLPDEAEAA